jgi:hypothetical protein
VILNIMFFVDYASFYATPPLLLVLSMLKTQDSSSILFVALSDLFELIEKVSSLVDNVDALRK